MGISSDSKQDFKFHVDQEIKKCNKLIGLSQLLSTNVSRKALITVYKSFIRLHLDYDDILYEKPENENFKNKLIRACFAITVVIQGTPRQKIYDNLGLHSLSKKR